VGAAAVAIQEQSDYQVTIGETRAAIIASERGPVEVVSFLSPAVNRGIEAGNRLLDALHNFLRSTPSDESLQLVRSATESSLRSTQGVVDLGAHALKIHPHYWTVGMQSAYESQLEELEDVIETFDLVLTPSFQAELARRIDAAETNGVVDDEHPED
jgi:hypothetical protein